LSFSSLGERVSVGVKARVLYSRLLSEADYLAILDSETVSQALETLRSTAYGEFLAPLTNESHRDEIEAAVRATLISSAQNFMVHLGNPRDKLFKAWFSLYEAENLKSIFRNIMSGRTSKDDLRRRLYPITATKISFEKVLLAKGFSDVIESLRDTRFYRVLAEPLRNLSSGEERSLFPVEMALDAFVETAIFKTLHRFEPAERNVLLPIFGARVDLHNIYSLYRAMSFYDLTPEETLNRLLPVRYRISISALREAVRFKSTDELLSFIKERFPVYSMLFDGVTADEETQLMLERNFKRYLYMQARKVFTSGTPDFHTAISYFILRNSEIADITRMIESVRYGYDRRKAATYLVAPVFYGGEPEWRY
jgi:V/A-type H+-transporting ATPase subunit C